MNTHASAPSSGAGPDGTPGGAPDGVPPVEQFFDRIRALGVVRPDEGRWAAGVCAGLARRWALDPLLVRGLFVVVSIVSGFGLGLYGLAWLFLPHPDGRIHAQQVLRGVVTSGFVGSALFVLSGFSLGGHWATSGGGGTPFAGLPFLVVVGLGIWWFSGRHRRHTVPGGSGGSGGSGGHAGTGGSGPASPSAPGASGGGAPDASSGRPATTVPAYGTPPGTSGSPAGGGPESETRYGSPPTSSYGSAVGGPAPGGYSSTGYAAGGYAAGGYAPTGHAPGAAVAVPTRRDLSRPLRGLSHATLGVALVAAGAVLVWNRWVGTVAAPGLVAAAVALGVLALGIVAAGLAGRRPGVLAPIAVLLAVVSANGATWQGTNLDTGQTVDWSPVSSTAAAAGYDLGAGRAVLDLTNSALTTGATPTSPLTVPASMGAGELVVIVPTTVRTSVEASVGLGAISDRVNDATDRGGPNVKETITGGPGTLAPVIVVQAKVGLGHIEVVPQGTEVTR